MDLSQASVVITGGASGLGAATARVLAPRAARIVLADRAVEPGEALAAELGDHVRFHEADVTSEADLGAVMDRATDGLPLRALICCAGVGWAARMVGRDGSPHPLDLFQKVIAVNLVGTFNAARLAAARMAAQDPDADGVRGTIVQTASVAGFEGQKGQVAYAASKAGVIGMTLPMARDLARRRVRVMTIAPGTFDTPMLRGVPQEVFDSLAAAVPFPDRLGDPAEFGRLVESLLDQPYLNGSTVRLDGALRLS